MENRLLPVRKYYRMTVGDILLLELPHIKPEIALEIAWEFTGYPSFFMTNDVEWHWVDVFRRQLREFREGKDNRGLDS